MTVALKILKLRLLIFGCLLLLSCEEDTIELQDRYYQDSGRGTNSEQGSLEIRFSGFNDGGNVDFIEVYFSAVRGFQRIGKTGSRSVYFDHIDPGSYTYNIDVFEWRQSVGGSAGVAFGIGSGGISSSPVGSIYSAPKHEHLFLDGSAEIRAGQTLIIEIKI